MSRIDWLAISLRWLALLSMALTLATQGRLAGLLLLVFLLGAIWNLLLSILTAFGRRLPIHPWPNIIADMLLGYTLFFLSVGSDDGLAWAGVLPLISGSLFLGIPGALLITLMNLLVQGFLVALSDQLPADPFSGLTLMTLYLIVGLALGWISARILKLDRDRQRSLTDQRRKIERGQRDHRSAIFKLISAMSATLNYQQVLEMALDLSANAMRSDGTEAGLVSAALLFTGSKDGNIELRIGLARRFTSADQTRLSLPGKTGLIGSAVEAGEPRFSKDLAHDPELNRIPAIQSCQAAYCHPLRGNQETYGVLLFAHPDPEFFTAERREVLGIIGNQAAISMQNAQLYHNLELEIERMVELQEESRKKLARDLHDGPTQSLAALAMRASFARRLIHRDANAIEAELNKIEDLARRATKELRHMLFTLRPLVLETDGLVAALESMAEKMRETYNQDVDISADPEIICQMEVGKQRAIFYIAEEAVNNARKHARAANIWVRLKEAGDGLVVLEIEDNGEGFNMESGGASHENGGSLYLASLRQRTELVNGMLQIDSIEGHGTRIRALIPLSSAATEQLRHQQ